MLGQFLIVILLCFSFLGAEEPIRVKVFKGDQIAPYLKKLILFIDSASKDYPYFYKDNNEDFAKHLASYSNSKDSIVNIAFDGNKIVGIAAGIPLYDASDEEQETLLKNGYDISKTFFIGKFLILQEYFEEKLALEMGRNIIQFVKEADRFNTIAVMEMNESMAKGPKPTKYISTIPLLNLLGFESILS